jgi:hypothetical protein
MKEPAMSTATEWRTEALAHTLKTPVFAPTAAKKRAPRAPKAQVVTDAPTEDFKPTMSPRLGNTRKVKATPLAGAVEWNPAKSPVLRDQGYTLTSHQLHPGMSVAQYPADATNTIFALNHLTHEGTEITYSDGTQAMVSRNAAFSNGVPTR